MKALTLVFLIVFTSCSLKEAADNGFKTKTDIEPIVKAETLAERYGNGKNAKISVKIPLSEDFVGYFDIDEVLGNRNLNSDQKGFLGRLKDRFKLALYNLAIALGYSSKIKYSTHFDFPEINPEYIKSARVKKVFFTTEDCRPDDVNCNGGKRSDFNFVDKFFLNVSSFTPEEAALEDEQGVVVVDDDEFENKATSSFNADEITGLIQGAADFEEVNLVKFKNIVPSMRLDTSKITGEEKGLFFETDKNKNVIKRYFKSDRFKELIKSVKTSEIDRSTRRRVDYEGVWIDLKKGVKPSEVFAQISKDQSPIVHKMVIFRLNGKYAEAHRLFNRPENKHLVKETTMIGRSLFVELRSEEAMKEFDNKFVNNENLHNELDIHLIEKCDRSNCLDLKTNDLNLVPMLIKNNSLQLDTYISLRHIGNVDFKYNGYVEVEVELNLPL